MPVRKNIVFDAKTNEYLYEILVNLTPNQKGLLNRFELAQISTPIEIRKFVSNAPMDAKLSLFTKVGFAWAMLFFNPYNFGFSDIRKVADQYQTDGAPVENINDMVRKQYFVYADKQAALCLALADSNCHGDVWSINKEFLLRAEDMRELSKKLAEKNQNAEYLAGMKAMHRLNKLLLTAEMQHDYGRSVHGLQPTDMAILRFLFNYPNHFVRVSVIQKRLRLLFKPTTTATRCRKLYEAGYIEKVAAGQERKPAFQIKAKGVLVVGDYLNKIVNEALGEL